jgi:hypothetical protein
VTAFVLTAMLVALRYRSRGMGNASTGKRPMKPFTRPPFILCAQCGAALIAPILVEHLDERHVRNLWSCDACCYQFETTVYFPSEVAVGQTQAVETVALVH